jgi:hypothetical protein
MFLPFVQLCKWAGRTLCKENKIKWIAHNGEFSSLLFFASLCCSVREGRCCTLERASTSLHLLSTTFIFLQASKIWVCALYLFLLIHTGRQSILFDSPRALLLLLGLSALHPVTGRRSGVFSVYGKCFMRFSFQWVFPQYGVLTIGLFSLFFGC